MKKLLALLLLFGIVGCNSTTFNPPASQWQNADDRGLCFTYYSNFGSARDNDFKLMNYTRIINEIDRRNLNCRAFSEFSSKKDWMRNWVSSNAGSSSNAIVYEEQYSKYKPFAAVSIAPGMSLNLNTDCWDMGTGCEFDLRFYCDSKDSIENAKACAISECQKFYDVKNSLRWISKENLSCLAYELGEGSYISENPYFFARLRLNNSDTPDVRLYKQALQKNNKNYLNADEQTTIKKREDKTEQKEKDRVSIKNKQIKEEQDRIAELERKAQNEKDLLEKEEQEILLTVQAFLYALGYAPGDEGGFDFRTKTAIKAYQKDSGITPIDGEISEELFINLQSSYSKKQKTLNFNNYSIVSTGSGYLIDKKGHVVTNAHVIDGCSIITTGKNNTAEILRADENNDIAIIKTSDIEEYRAMSFANQDPALGQRIFVSGFPLNEILENLNFTSGTVSSEVGLLQNINQFQFTAPIQPGNSGGPILNEYGGVVGMSVASVSTKKFEEFMDTLVQNINFGIRQSSIQSLLEQENIKYEKGNPQWFASEEAVAKEAKSGTMLIKCWAPDED